MTEDRKKILIEYMAYLSEIGTHDFVVGRNVRYVLDFLKKAESITKAGYLKYRKMCMCEHIQSNKQNEATKAITSLLDFKGIGYKSRKERKVLGLKKLSGISERNQKILAEFTAWLTDNFDYSPRTVHSYYFGVKLFFEYASDVTMDSFKRYVATMEANGFAPSTISLRMAALEKLSQFVKRPIKLNRPKLKRKLDTDNVPTESDYSKLLSFLGAKKNKDYYYWMRILATSGARFFEFVQFTWEDIIKGEVELKGKGNKYRRFFFQKELSGEIRKYASENNKTGVFATSRLGTPITNRGLAVMMKDWGNSAGIERKKMHPHAFRHFFAKMFLKKNKDLVQLADLMGHASLDTTRIYTQKSHAEQKRDFTKNVTW